MVAANVLSILNAKCLLSSSFKFKQFLCKFHLKNEKKKKIPEQAGCAWPPGLAFGIKSKVNPDVWAGLSA